jgi:hypothetical protein
MHRLLDCEHDLAEHGLDGQLRRGTVTEIRG